MRHRPAEIPCEGTPDSVRDEVGETTHVLGEGGGFILGPGHTYIQPDAPLANILAMYGTAYHDGIYRQGSRTWRRQPGGVQRP